MTYQRPPPRPCRMTFFPPPAIVAEMRAEAKRTGKSLSGLLRIVWRVARPKLRRCSSDTERP